MSRLTPRSPQGAGPFRDETRAGQSQGSDPYHGHGGQRRSSPVDPPEVRWLEPGGVLPHVAGALLVPDQAALVVLPDEPIPVVGMGGEVNDAGAAACVRRDLLEGGS